MTMKSNSYLSKILGLAGALVLSLGWSAQAQYCTATYTNACATSGDFINDFSTQGGSTNISNLGTGCNGQTDNYIYYPGQVLTCAVNDIITLNLQSGSQWAQGFSVWIDWDQNSVYDVTDLVYSSSNAATSLFTGTFSVPPTALGGLTRMRVRCRYNAVPTDPCTNYVFGETEEYDVQVGQSVPCSLPVIAGTVNASAASACPNQSVNLIVSGQSTGAGITYQWQSSPDGTVWTDIVGATSFVYTTTITATTSFRCGVSCSASPSEYTAPVAVNLNDFFSCYCNTNLGGGCTSGGITEFSISGTPLLNTNTLCDNLTATNYSVYPISPNTTADLQITGTYNFNITTNNNTISSIWIDYDHSGTFDPSEWTQVSVTSTANQVSTASITIPVTALTGLTGMRVRSRLNGNTNNETSACLQMGSGSTQDYVVNLLSPVVCSGAPNAGLAAANDSSLCPNTNFNLFLQGADVALGLSYQWQTSADGLTGWTDVAGATSSILQTTTPTTAYYRCVVTCGTDASNSGSVMITAENCITLDGTNYTSCSGSFYDPGVTANYSNNTNLTTTITPSTPGAYLSADFTSFNLEDGFDFLYVYDGTSTAAPLIGTFTGATSPGVVTASNSTGALTFRFTSDGSVSLGGWVANLACVAVAPSCATITAPADGAVDVCTTSGNISWAAQGATAGFIVNFGTSPTLANATIDTVFINAYYPGTLLANTTYYYQITPYNSFGNAPSCPIQSYTTGTCSNCNYSVNLFDSFGDGWNGGQVQVFVNGVEVAGSPFTLATGNGPGNFTFPINTGDSIVTLYTPGSFPAENSFTVANSFGQVIFTSGGNNVAPADTVTFVGLANCSPITNDASVGIMYTYGKIPVNYGTPQQVQVLVTNNNTFDPMNLPVTLTVSGANPFTNTQTVNGLAPGATALVTFANYSPTTPGISTMTISVPSDQNNADNTRSMDQEATANLYSYKYLGVANSGGVGFNGATGNFVTRFYSNGPQTINQIDIDFNTGGQPYELGIWDATGTNGAPGALIGTVTGLTSLAGTAYVTVSPAVAVDGYFYVGVRQTGTVNVAFSYQTENPVRGGQFYYSSPVASTTWQDFSVNNANFRPALDVEFSMPIPPNCAVYNLPAAGDSNICQNAAILNWASGGLAPDSYNVYLSTSPTLTGATPVNVTGLSFDPGTLTPNTTYYWQVVPQNSFGQATGCAIQSFTTGDCLIFPMTNDTITTCIGNFYDSGGLNANYQNNQNITETFIPASPNSVMQANFTAFQIENNFDFLNIYDGADATAPLIGTYTGTNSPGIVTAGTLNPGNAQLTFVFTSDNVVNQVGWEATLSCVDTTVAPGCVGTSSPVAGATNVSVFPTISWTPGTGTTPTGYDVYFAQSGQPLVQVETNISATSWTSPVQLLTSTGYCYKIVPRNANGFASGCDTICFTTDSVVVIPMSNGTLTACSGVWVDPAGISANYANNSNFTQTLTPSTPGNVMQVTFTSFNLEANFDFLRVYDGLDATAPLLGTFTGLTLPAAVTAGTLAPTNSSLTFVFTSDASVVRPGWQAIISCVDTLAAPGCVSNTLPADGSTNVNVNTSITWTPGPGNTPTGYDVYFAQQGGPLILVSPNQTTTSWTPPVQLALNTTYCYKVVARNAYGEAVGCATNCFTTDTTLVYLMSNSSDTTCSGLFTDSGGPNGNYLNSQNLTYTFTSASATSNIQVSFSSFLLENNWDFLKIYDGADATAPQIGNYTGANSPGVVTSGSLNPGNHSLTFVFTSDASVAQSGWTAAISCVADTSQPCIPPTITASGPTSFCSGGSVTLTSSATSSTWSTGETTQTITVSTSGTFTVSDAACSLASDPIIVNVISAPVPTVQVVGNDTICPGGSTQLVASLGGIPLPPGGATYSWSPSGQTSPAISVTQAGCYTVTVTAFGCTASSTPTCIVESNSIVTPVIASNNGNTICGGGSLDLTVGGSYASYTWSNGATTSTINVTTPGCYTVTVSNAGGCTATSAQFCITAPSAPTISASGNTTFCSGGSVFLTSSAATGNVWSTGATTQTITATQSGSYTVTVANGSCTATSAPVVVTVNTVVVPTITASATSVCAGNTVTLSCSSNPDYASYAWSNGATTQTVSAGPGTYSVTITSTNGCSATAPSITITTGSGTQPFITVGGPTTICQGEGVTMLSSSVTGNTWNFNGSPMPGQTGTTCTATQMGIYSLTVDINGCVSTSATVPVVVNPRPTANGSHTSNINGVAVFTNNSANFTASQWNFGDGTAFSNATNPVHTYNADGSYTVVLVAFNDCGSDSDTLVVNIFGTGVRELTHGETLSLFPNPTQDQVTVDFTDAHTQSLSVQLVDVSGQVIFSQSMGTFNGRYKQSIDMSGVAAGVYFVQLITDNDTITRKVLKN